jgi:hypothetical protein
MTKKRGRPQKYDDSFYTGILHNHRILSLSEIAFLCNVSPRTAARWVKKGREILSKNQL